MTSKTILRSVALLFCLASVGLLGATTAACGKWVPWDCFTLGVSVVTVLGIGVIIISLWSLGEPMRLPNERSADK